MIKNQLATQSVNPLLEDNLPPGQKENLNLFLEYKPEDKFDIAKENLSLDFYNHF